VSPAGDPAPADLGREDVADLRREVGDLVAVTRNLGLDLNLFDERLTRVERALGLIGSRMPDVRETAPGVFASDLRVRGSRP
jgi:hypothetical protein